MDEREILPDEVLPVGGMPGGENGYDGGWDSGWEAPQGGEPGGLRIKYNGEEMEIPYAEAVVLAQKGMNYDKVYARELAARQEMAARKAREASLVEQLAAEAGLSAGEFLDTLEARRLEDVLGQSAGEEGAPGVGGEGPRGDGGFSGGGTPSGDEVPVKGKAPGRGGLYGEGGVPGEEGVSAEGKPDGMDNASAGDEVLTKMLREGDMPDVDAMSDEAFAQLMAALAGGDEPQGGMLDAAEGLEVGIEGFLALVEKYPGIEELPAEAAALVAQGVPPLYAYEAYENSRLRAGISAREADLRNRATAPGSAVGMGEENGSDPFLQGFYKMMD